MENYQLYRTNILLSGQMKWDLILKSDNKHKQIFINDFHLTPISKSMPFDKKSNEDLLNYTHQENIKSYYNKVKDSFYDTFENADFKNNWPIIVNENEKITSYCNDFDMGCTRSEVFDLYNKQFEFFCPVWLEQLSENEYLVFVISIKSLNDKIISNQVLILNKNDFNSHNKFINYFNDYIKYIGLDKGDDRLLEIDFNKNLSKLTGLKVDSGNLVQQDINNLCSNLTNRERPLMESDNFIINSFSEYKCIAKQLFNFNLCFNLEDIIPKEISKTIKGNQIKISVDVAIKKAGNETKLDFLKKADFYSNYDYIPKKKCDYINRDQKLTEDINVLDYLQDNKSLNLINKNKYIQNIIHWSLNDNNDYIFNVYEGFSGYSLDKYKNNIYHSHLYDNAPDLTQDKYSVTLNNTGWCNMSYIDDLNTLDLALIYNSSSNSTNLTDFSKKINQKYKWVNNIKYNFNNLDEFNLHVLLIHTTTEILNLKKNKLTELSITSDKRYKNDKLYVYFSNSDNDNILIFLTDNLNNFTFNKCKKFFLDFTDESNSELYTSINNLYKIFNSAVNAPMICFDKSLFINKAKGPSYSVNEIEYYKDNNNNFSYMYRYDGKIKPTFIFDDLNDINHNYLYYKDYISDNRKDNKLSKLQQSVYAKYAGSGFPPIYKSINYCTVKSVLLKNHKDIPQIQISEHNKPISLIQDFEYKWFNNGIYIYLEPIINTVLYSEIENNEYVKLEKLIKKFIKSYYKLTDDTTVDYIYSKYNIENNFEYKTNEDIKNYKYNIKLILK